ncbi:MAG: hypothetical protein PQJ49_07860, partial [Sphaerochaetaceae bacterium]|nr:hypothetical protein [Sphaerochaetaceae bacterium]
MKTSLQLKQSQKQCLNLNIWNPLISSNISDLNGFLENYATTNPLLDIKKSDDLEEFYLSFNNQKQSL